MKITISKSVEVYRLRECKNGEWADIYIEENENGNGGTLFIRSGYGSWDYYWGSAGSTLKEFICSISTDYLIGKLARKDEFDYDRWRKAAEDEVKAWYRDKQIDKDEKRNLLEELIELDKEGFQSSDALYVYMRENNLQLYQQFCDGPCFPEGNDYPRGLLIFVENIWNPFIKELKKELSLQEA